MCTEHTFLLLDVSYLLIFLKLKRYICINTVWLSMCVYSMNVSLCPTMVLKKINPNTDCLVRPLSNFHLIPCFFCVFLFFVFCLFVCFFLSVCLFFCFLVIFFWGWEGGILLVYKHDGRLIIVSFLKISNPSFDQCISSPSNNISV